MLTADYHLLDVFTEERFGGNQLAVFPDADDIPDSLLLTIAQELNLSETVFVRAAENPDHACQLRIFTPGGEIPMAGHPTVGAGHLLALLGLVDLPPGGGSVTFEERVGPVTVDITMEGITPTFVEMHQPLPQFGPTFDDRALLAELLSLATDDLLPGLPAEVVSCGVPFLLVALRSPEVVDRANLRLDLWQTHLAGFASPHVFLFATVPDQPATIHSRMFGPAFGIVEDPATGAASGPAGAYLVRHGLFGDESGCTRLTSHQGVVMGRPSQVYIEIDHTGAEINAVRVAGECVYVGQGTLLLEAD